MLLFMSVLAMAVGQLFFYKEEASVVKSRVQKLSQVPEELRGEFRSPGEVEGPKKTLLSGIDLKPVLGKFTGEAFFTKIEEDLARADIPLRVTEFLIFRGVLYIVGLLVGFALLKSVSLALLFSLPFSFSAHSVFGHEEKGPNQ
ncbi:MAG: hypothetical protein HC904_08315 [Blastochloris sp.]|nr:hypothetical protein [Blastochloris sp.]